MRFFEKMKSAIFIHARLRFKHLPIQFWKDYLRRWSEAWLEFGVPNGKSIHFGLTWPYTQFHVGWPAPKCCIVPWFCIKMHRRSSHDLRNGKEVWRRIFMDIHPWSTFYIIGALWQTAHIIQKHTTSYPWVLILTLAIIAPAASASTQPLISLSQCKNANFLRKTAEDLLVITGVMPSPFFIFPYCRMSTSKDSLLCCLARVALRERHAVLPIPYWPQEHWPKMKWWCNMMKIWCKLAQHFMKSWDLITWFLPATLKHQLIEVF